MAPTAARHPRSCSGKLMRAGRRRSGADSRLSAARGETPLSPRAVALCPHRPSFPRRRAPSGPPSPPSAGAALTAPRRSARARPRPRAHLPRSSRPRSRRGRPYTAPLGRSAAAPGVYRARGPPRPARPSASGQSRPRSAWGSAARPCAAPPGCEGSGVACAAPAPAAAGQCRAPVVARPAACPRHGLWPAA